MKKRILTLLLTVVMILPLFAFAAIPTEAATVNSTFNSKKTVTFTVKTNKSGTASIKFTSKAATESTTVNRAFFGKKTITHKCSHAPKLKLIVTDNKGNSKYYFVQKGLLESKREFSSTLKLDKNTTYTVKVCYLYDSSNGDCHLAVDEVASFHPGEMVANGGKCYVNGTWTMKPANCTVSNIKVK